MQIIVIVAISASHVSLLYEMNIMIFFSTGLIFTSEICIIYKRVWGLRGLVAANFDIP